MVLLRRELSWRRASWSRCRRAHAARSRIGARLLPAAPALRLPRRHQAFRRRLRQPRRGQGLPADIIKLDPVFIRRAREDRFGRELLEEMLALCGSFAPSIVVHGIEREEDIRMALDAGAEWPAGLRRSRRRAAARGTLARGPGGARESLARLPSAARAAGRRRSACCGTRCGGGHAPRRPAAGRARARELLARDQYWRSRLRSASRNCAIRPRCAPCVRCARRARRARGRGAGARCRWREAQTRRAPMARMALAARDLMACRTPSPSAAIRPWRGAPSVARARPAIGRAIPLPPLGPTFPPAPGSESDGARFRPCICIPFFETSRRPERVALVARSELRSFRRQRDRAADGRVDRQGLLRRLGTAARGGRQHRRRRGRDHRFRAPARPVPGPTLDEARYQSMANLVAALPSSVYLIPPRPCTTSAPGIRRWRSSCSSSPSSA